MEPMVSTRTALLQALRQGPGYGLELVARLQRLTGHRLALGSVYPALEGLKHGGLARAWKVVPGGRRGARSRTYYELTYPGLLRAQADATALRALLTEVPAHPAVRRPSAATLARRLARVSDLIAFTEDLRDAREEGR
jgi:DNA-binding PadR family transcriptional regulator